MRSVIATQTTIYLGSVELIRTGSTTETRRYLAGVAIDYVRSSGANEIRFLFADHLGSLDVVASSTGAPIETASFDVHGSRRDPVTWQGPAPVPTSTTRGYTGHEHVDGAGFIHMNGRLYDPALGRMLQADPLTGPGPQGLNRYSYVANNPLTLTDPSGYSWWKDLLGVAIAVFAPELLPATWGVWAYVASGFVAGTVAGGNLQGGLYGAFSAGLFYGVGNYFQNSGWAFDNGTACTAQMTSVGLTAKVVSSGIAGGVMSSLEGGKFGNGFLAAGATTALAPTIDSIGNGPGQVVAGAIVGGTVSEISGGNFGNGAMTGAFAQLFQEVANGARQGERGTWVYPAGGSTDINDYVGADGNIRVVTNGILGDPSGFQELVNSQLVPTVGYYNPSHGILDDLLESFGQKFFGWSGDPLAQGFASVASQANSPLNVVAHSQGVLTVVDAVAYYGLSAEGSSFDFRSGALSYYSAASVIEGGGGTMTWSMPYGDIANLYAPSFNPIQWASGFHDVFCAACTHISNGLQRQ